MEAHNTAPEAQRKEQTNSVKEIEKKHAIEVCKLMTTIEKLEGTIEVKDSKILGLVSTLKAVKGLLYTVVEDLVAEELAIDSKIHDLEAELTTECEVNDHLLAFLDGMERKHQATVRKFTEFRAKSTAADNERVLEVQNLVAQLDAAKDENEELKALLVAAQDEITSQSKKAEEQRKELEAKVEELECKHLVVQSEMKTTIERLERTVAVRDASDLEMVSQIDSLNLSHHKHNEKMRENLRALNYELMKVQEEKFGLTKMLEDSKKMHHKLQKSCQAELLEMKRVCEVEKSSFHQQVATQMQSYEAALEQHRQQNGRLMNEVDYYKQFFGNRRK